MMTSKLTGRLRFETAIRNHTLIVDQPEGSGGTDTGPTPPELVVAALGTCVGVYAVHFCEKHGISTEGLTVHTEWEKADKPTRIGKMAAKIELPAGIPEEKREAFMKTVEQCMVHNTFCVCPEVSIELTEPLAPHGCCCCKR